MKRKNTLEFFRFVFCCIVCLHHLNSKMHFAGGYLGVDIFFVISGYFVMDHFYRKNNSDESTPEQKAFRYWKERLIRILPHHLFSWFVLTAVLVFVRKQFTLDDIIRKGFWDLFLLRGTGLGTDISINGVTWYLSVMLICSYLIYWFLCKDKNFYLYIWAPLFYFGVMSFI